MIALDTLSEAGVIGPSADGNIDDPQFRWLEDELKAATDADELVILFSHHAIPSLTANVPDESAPPCTGHRLARPRGRTRAATSTRATRRRSTSATTSRRCCSSTRTRSPGSPVTPTSTASRPTPTRTAPGGFWSIRVAAEADWPMQSRLVELFDNGDGTLSLFGTILDYAGNATAPAPGPAASFSTEDLASVGRTLAYNDTQTGARACRPGPCGEGEANDRNVELLVADPRRNPDGGAASCRGRVREPDRGNPQARPADRHRGR